MSEGFDHRLLSGNQDALSSFMDEAPEAIVVDWREEEENIVRSVSDALTPDSLTYYWLGEDLVIGYNGMDTPVGLTFSPRDRYICLRAINTVLKGRYELRLFRPSYYSDTHQFLVKPVAWWEAFDRLHPERSSEVFGKIDEGLDFP